MSGAAGMIEVSVEEIQRDLSAFLQHGRLG